MRRSLLIGIDNYPAAPLTGAVRDVTRLQPLIEAHGDGSPNFACRVETAPLGGRPLSRAGMWVAIEELFTRDATSALLHFSGHGVQTSVGGVLVTSDGQRHDEGISMNDMLLLANKSSIPEITISLDCCHSGAVGQGMSASGTGVTLREGVSLIAASGSSEVAMEKGGAGLFTALMCEALEGGAADVFGNVTLPALFTYVEAQLGAWDQRPRFRANLSRCNVLRTVAPRVPLEMLRELPKLFSGPTVELPLTPAHEPAAEPHDAEKEAIMARLQRLAREGLVEPLGEQHMYYAAMNSKGCRLTPAGRRCWHLAATKRI